MLKDERRVFALTLTDGAQAVVLLTLLPFILLRHVATTPSMGTTGLGALSAGFSWASPARFFVAGPPIGGLHMLYCNSCSCFRS